MLRKLLLLMSALVCSRDARAQVTGGSATVEVGGTAILPCKLTQSLTAGQSMLQISWQRKTKGKPKTDNFITIKEDEVVFVNGQDKRFQYIGKFADHNGALQLSNVKLMDAGTYTCIFSIFPFGNPSTSIPLTVLVPLQTSVNDTLPTLGNKEVPLATCTAAGFNPPADVLWKTDGLKDKVRWTNNSTLDVSDTTTTVSTLLGKPTKEINRSRVQCVIFSEKLNQTLPFEIQIYYPPLKVNIKKGPVKDLGFTCEAEGNPNPNITWSRSGNPLPPAVTVQGATLTFEKKSTDLAGLYQCEANNSYGSKESFLYVDFPPGGREFQSQGAHRLKALLLMVTRQAEGRI
ncbi:poliovirus receptor isoform 2-T2 [Anableps anableps]